MNKDVMSIEEKAALILSEIEYYLAFDGMQREYAERGIINALKKIGRSEEGR